MLSSIPIPSGAGVRTETVMFLENGFRIESGMTRVSGMMGDGDGGWG